MSYIDDMILHVQQKNATQPEFVQAATEVLDSIRPVVEANRTYQDWALLERLVEPERATVSASRGRTTRARFTRTAATEFSSTAQ